MFFYLSDGEPVTIMEWDDADNRPPPRSRGPAKGKGKGRGKAQEQHAPEDKGDASSEVSSVPTTASGQSKGLWKALADLEKKTDKRIDGVRAEIGGVKADLGAKIDGQATAQATMQTTLQQLAAGQQQMQAQSAQMLALLQKK